jgi:hypothetical protein
MLVASLLFSQCHHMSLMDFVVPPPGCGRSVTDFWGWDAHEAQLCCPDEVDGDTWIWSTRRGLKPWESSPSRKNPHGRTGNRTRDLMISIQKLLPLDNEADLLLVYYSTLNFKQKYLTFKTVNWITPILVIFVFLFSPPWGWQREWPKHVGDLCAIKLHP